MRLQINGARASGPARSVPFLLAIAWLAANSVLAQQPTEGLVAYWPFDEFKDKVTSDVSGHGNDLIVTASLQVKGVRNTGLEMTELDSSARCIVSRVQPPAEALTLEAWVKPRAVGFVDYPTIIRKDSAYALRFGGTRLAFLLWFEGKPIYLESAKTDWVADQWYHLAATYDGAQMRLFIDGAEDSNSPREQKGAVDTSLDNCAIGAGAGGGRFRGVIDEVRLYHRALSPQEVQASYAFGRQALEAERDRRFEPKPVGVEPVAFRKPARDIKMIEDGFLWIDAEDFSDYGGWQLDTQFVHLMGSAYLIAAGVGTPVKDATLTIDVPKAGRYRLWVRAKNWLKDYSPGQFRVLVGDRLTEKVFGAAPSEEWLWESGGEFDLEQGEVQIALRDLTGYFARCDAVVLTTDLSYTPPSKMDELQVECRRLTGLPLEPELVGEFDVVVVGAGVAGCCAAVAAARGGAKTALIQNRPVLGGNASSEIGVGVNGAASGHPNARESGIVEEIGRIKARFGYRGWSEALRMVTEQERNLTVFVNQHVVAVEMANAQHIASVKAVDTLTGGFSVYRGRVFLDCTGDGWIGYYAGAQYRFGREPRDEFGESLAPEKSDQITMSGCLMGEHGLAFRSQDTGKPVQYLPPPWAPKFPSAEEFGRNIRYFTGGEWWLEHQGTIDDLWDAEKARDELIRISFGYWDYIKNVWPERQLAANYAMVYVPYLDAKRESRRLVGDYILTQNDVQKAVVFPDRISYGGWPLDVHHPEGIYSGKEGPYHCTPPVPLYTIPYRCLYSVNIDNLLFAGRHVSVTHIALGTVRVQGTLATLGQAAGTAAAMCLRYGTTPRGIYQQHLKELQQTLVKDDQYIPGVVNEDPKDLARRARLSASSSGDHEEFGKAQVQKDELHPMSTCRAMMFPRGENRRLGSVYLLLASSLETPVPVTLHIREAQSCDDFSLPRDIATVKTEVPPGQESWVEFKVGREVEMPFLWVWLEPAKGLSWRRMATAPLGARRAWGQEGDWHVVANQYYAFYTEPALALKTDFAVENLTNGVTRIVDTHSNLWASDPTKPLPQWVELAWDTPVEINSVYLTFDTDMNAAYHNVPVVAQCVRDYEVAYHDGSEWVTVASVEGNFQRRRVHRFAPVSTSRLRLTILATNGAKSARVFEIRVYKE